MTDGPTRFRPPRFFIEAMKPIVGQEELKRRLAYAFSHYTLFLDDPFVGRPVPLIYGPSGSGKTFSMELCCEALGMPFSVMSAGSISPAGFKGQTLRDLLSQHYMIHQTSEGVIFLDEFDKLCMMAAARGLEKPDAETLAMSTAKQAELLKYVEHEDVHLTDEAKDLMSLRKRTEEPLWTPEQQTPAKLGDEADDWTPAVFETRKSMWVLAGAFDGLNHVIRSRLRQDAMNDEADLWSKASPEDFRRYGVQPELLNRCDVHIWVRPLKATQMLEILMAQDVPRYVRLFEAVGCQLDLQPSALVAACELAVHERTGARGASLRLKHVMSEVYTAVDDLELTSFTVDAHLMLHGQPPVSRLVDGQPLQQLEGSQTPAAPSGAMLGV